MFLKTFCRYSHLLLTMTHGTKGYWKPISVIILRGQILICLIYVLSLRHNANQVFFTCALCLDIKQAFYLNEGAFVLFPGAGLYLKCRAGVQQAQMLPKQDSMLMRTWSWHPFQGVHIFMSQEKHTNMDKIIVKELINMHPPCVCIHVDSRRQTHTHTHTTAEGTQLILQYACVRMMDNN